MFSRRQVLQLMAWSAGIPLLAPRTAHAALPQITRHPIGARTASAIQLSPDDDAFLEQIEQANFLYFWEQTNPKTGLVRGPLQCEKAG